LQTAYLFKKYQINILLNTGSNQPEIAKEKGIHKSTISRELKRNRGSRGHHDKQAQKFANQRKSISKRRIRAKNWKIIEPYLRKDFNPEQASPWVLKYFGIQVSRDWIYQYIWEDKRNGCKGDSILPLMIVNKNWKIQPPYAQSKNIKYKRNKNESCALFTF
jgi:IS30 family transposase